MARDETSSASPSCLTNDATRKTPIINDATACAPNTEQPAPRVAVPPIRLTSWTFGPDDAAPDELLEPLCEPATPALRTVSLPL